jgi:aspartate/glutamate racemase
LQKDKTTEKWDELGDKLNDAAKKLEDAVVQLVLDLDINKDKPEDKE